MWFTPCIRLALKSLIFPPNLKLSFIVTFWICDHSVSKSCSFSKIRSRDIQWVTVVGLPTLVAGVQRLAHISSALMLDIPKSTNCGAGILMGSADRFIRQRVYISQMDLSDILSQITPVKMGGETRLLVKFWWMEVYNLLDFFKSGIADFRILSIYGITLRLQVGGVVPMGILVMLPLV